MSSSPKVIVVVNGKGGVGKTTTAMALSGILAEEFKVLAVDADSQGSFSWWTQRSQNGMDFDLVRETNPELLKDLQKVTEYEFVVVDTPPALSSKALVAAIAAADYLVLPTPPAPLDLAVLIETIKEVVMPLGVTHRVLFTRVSPRSLGEAREAQKTLMELGIPTFNTFVRAYKAHERAALEGKPITQWRGKNAHKAEADYRQVIHEIQLDWRKL
jgi:chromosome partitioning protein